MFAFRFGSSSNNRVSPLALNPPRRMNDDNEGVGDVAYVGFSIHFATRMERKRLFNVISGNGNVRANRMNCLEYKDFVFLLPERAMNKKAIDCWRWRKELGDLSVCLHTDAATAVEGLSTTMLPVHKEKMHALFTTAGHRGYGRRFRGYGRRPESWRRGCNRCITARGWGYGRYITPRGCTSSTQRVIDPAINRR